MDARAGWLIALAVALLVNLITYAVFWIDKRRARRERRRLRERTLIAWCAVGGWPAGFVAMRRLRHKTRDRAFRLRYWGCVALWALAIGGLVWIWV